MPDGSPLFGVSMRQPPANVQAEMALLGAVLRNNRALDRCGHLRPEHFAGDGLGAVFAAIQEGVGAGRVVDAVSLRSRFDHALLASLLASMVAIEPASEYARVIVDCAHAREMIDAMSQAVEQLFVGGAPADLAAQVSAQIDRIAQGRQLDRVVTLDAAMDAALAAMEEPDNRGISTGFHSLDTRLGGLEPGLVYVIAGRPGMGKSSIGHQIAVNAARQGIGVLELSLEMSATQLGRRTLASAAGVSIMAIKNGQLSNHDAARVVAARKELAGLPLTIDDAGGQTPSMIAAKARAASRKHGLGLLMIDHLNLMRADEADARHGGTWAVGRASNTVLQIAKDCDCPVLLLSQLNRGVEGRDDKRPTLSDLRQAGDIEQDAYAVGFVYRPEYYLGSEPEPKEGESPIKLAERRGAWADRKAAAHGVAEIIWAKVRDGEPGTDTLRFHGQTATFSESEYD